MAKAGDGEGEVARDFLWWLAVGRGDWEGNTNLSVREDRINIIVGHPGGCCADGFGPGWFWASSLLQAARTRRDALLQPVMTSNFLLEQK